jgi:hypothetical protein
MRGTLLKCKRRSRSRALSAATSDAAQEGAEIEGWILGIV